MSRFLLDENVDVRVAIRLRALGHDVKIVAVDYEPQMPDEAILARAVVDGRILITNDRDFSNLIFRRQLPHAGVIYLRQGRSPVEDVISRIETVLRDHSAELHRFLVVTTRTVRIR
jgi:predicted nuclease of predicted toxin-antitoxin system